MAEWIDVAGEDELADGEMMAAVARGVPVVLFRVDGAFSALHDLCSHGQARLSDGFVEGGCVECPLHQGLFDVRTGAPKSPPATEPVRAFPVRVSQGRVEIEV
jgi:nitrite reductase/ring-hydroxylating ferredoxin subunit